MADARDSTYRDLECLQGTGGDSRWVTLPSWASSLLQLGTYLSRQREPDFTIVVSLPFRDFAATLLALGCVVERVQAGSFEDRFKPGDLVLTIHRNKDGERTGQLAEFSGYLPPREPTTPPGVSLKRAREIAAYGQWRSGGVQLVRYSGGKGLPKQKPTTIALPSSNFRTALVGPDEDVWLSGRTIVGLVGHFPTLLSELDAKAFRFASDNIEGQLGEVLLLDGNIRKASTSNAEAIEDLRENAPELVIFDGATSFGKWRHMFDSSRHAVVMDRSSRYWHDEVSIISAAMAGRVNTSAAVGLPLAFGTGLDILGFRR